jgi:eukaryotic-like serine/threonine-protein kinase
MAWSDSDLPVEYGEVVDGKYRVERLIGAGGMGCVVEATHLQLLQRVAMKFVLASEEGPDGATRLVREARAAVALRSDHVARVLDVGTLPNGMPYLVMEYLEGKTLAGLLAGGARLAPEDARRVAIETCRALGEAHRRGIVHRDVKPANLFLANLEDGSTRVKVLDFGIAKVTDPHMAVDPQLTGTEHTLGTPRYMAPEQLSATRDVDARADVWATGIVLYECLVGSNPFARGGTAFEIGARILVETAPRVSATLPNVPPDLDEIVARCLERERSARFVDANELLTALEGQLAIQPKTRIGLGPLRSTVQLPPQVALPTTKPPRPRALAQAEARAPAIAIAGPRERAPESARTAVISAAIVAAVVAVTATGIVIARSRRHEEATPVVEPSVASTSEMPTSAPVPPASAAVVATAESETATPPAPTPTPSTSTSTKASASSHSRTKHAPAPAASPKASSLTRPPNER